MVRLVGYCPNFRFFPQQKQGLTVQIRTVPLVALALLAVLMVSYVWADTDRHREAGGEVLNYV